MRRILAVGITVCWLMFSVATGVWAAVVYHSTTGVVFSPDGKLLISCHQDGRVLEWAVPSGRLAGELTLKNRLVVTKLQFTPDGTELVESLVNGTLGILKWRTSSRGLSDGAQTYRETMVRIGQGQDDVTGLVFSPNGLLLAMPGYGQNGKLVDFKQKLAVGSVGGNAATFSPDGHMLAVGNSGGQVQILDVLANRQIQLIQAVKGRVVNAVAFSADGKWLAVGCGDKHVRLYDAHTWALGRDLVGHGAVVNDLAFSPNSRLLASSGFEPGLRLWDLTSHKSSHTLQAPTAGLGCVAFSRNGAFLACGGLDGSVILWSASGHLLALQREQTLKP